MSDTRKNHLTIDGGQVKEDEHVSSYKPIPESDTEFRTSKTSLHKSKEKLSPDGAEEKLLKKEDEAKIVTRVDMVDAKYAVGDHRNGDAKIELDANKRQFTGLTKEELMKYAEDPFWVRLRWFMFVLFWALWLCMLAGAIIIIVRAPKCPKPPPRTWYEKGLLVDTSTEQDFSVVEQQLKGMQDAKVSGIFSFTCSDSYEVLEESSSCLEQFKQFATKAKEYGIKVIADLTANFVPKDHKWFQLSQNRTGHYSDYFIWGSSTERDPTNGQALPPNNWVSTLDAPAWTFSEERQEFYLHQFGEEQPDLNLTNLEVVKHFDAVIKAWMQAGAAGIRLHNARELLVDAALPADVARAGAGSEPGADHTQYAHWLHRNTRDLPALDGLLAHWSHLVATNVPSGSDETVFTIAEKSRPELFVLARNTSSLRPPSAAPVSLDDPAVAATLISDRLRRWPILPLTGASSDDEELAAFATLLPAAPVLQLQQFNQTGTSESLSRVASLREEESVQHGQHMVLALSTVNTAGSVIACDRWKLGHTGYVSVYNPGDEETLTDLSGLRSLPAELTVYRAPGGSTNYTVNAVVHSNNVLLPPKSAMIFSYVRKAEAEE